MPNPINPAIRPRQLYLSNSLTLHANLEKMLEKMNTINKHMLILMKITILLLIFIAIILFCEDL